MTHGGQVAGVLDEEPVHRVRSAAARRVESASLAQLEERHLLSRSEFCDVVPTYRGAGKTW